MDSTDLQVGKLIGAVDSLKDSVASLQEDVKVLSDAVSKARGGWITLMAVGSVVAVLVEAAHYFFNHKAP